MKRNRHFWRHAKNIQRETKNAVILSDVAGKPPERQTEQKRKRLLSTAKKDISNHTDGKTWTESDKSAQK